MAGTTTSYDFTVTFPTRNEAPCGVIVKLDVAPWTDIYLMLFNYGYSSSSYQEPSWIQGRSFYQAGDLGVFVKSLLDGSCTINVLSANVITKSNVHIAPVYKSDLRTILNGP